jgi:hypothetical protein
VVGLGAYELGDRVEHLGLARTDWPDLTCARYPTLLAFDHHVRQVVAVGRGETEAKAKARAADALTWLDATTPDSVEPVGPLCTDLIASDANAYEAAVAQVVERILSGEIFQANIARAWTGRLAAGVDPFDLFVRLRQQSPAPFSAYWRLPGRALVSNSPERFLKLDPSGAIQTQPIKGTRPRGRDAAEDRALAAELLASDKDRAENLMIVDLMRNDLARVAPPGSVRAPTLFAVESFANVHHLVSTVTARLAPGRGVADLLRASFPPGSITAAGLGLDSEGIAYRAATGSVFVSDEVASSITQFDAATGATLGGVAVPAIYTSANVQSNMGLESLAFGPGGLWTANEEALVPDGPLSTTSEGSWVRIQRFDTGLAAAGQWGYRTDPISALNPFISAERSGVVDVLPWTATTLLVLERELGGAVVPTFRSRLYGVDVTTASDVSAVPSLAGGGFTPLSKTLLWEGLFGSSNFEGMTFGPALPDGSTSLLLISDDGGGLSQNLYALSVVPEPGTVALMLVAAGLAVPFARRCRAHR